MTHPRGDIAVTTDHRRSIRTSTCLVLALVATAAFAAACGGASSSGGSSSGGSGSGGSAGGSETPGGGASPGLRFAFSQVTGKVASVGPNGVAVTTSSGRHNVAFASSTQFSKLATIGRSAVAVGDCVSVSRPAGSSPGTAGASTVTATAVTVTGTSTCAAPRFGAGAHGSRPSPPSEVPSGAPTAQPGGGGSAAPFGSGQRPGGGRFGGGIAGTVTAMTGSTIVLKPSFGSTSHITAKTSGATTYRQRASSTASDATKGTCVTALGRTASNALDAFEVTLSAPTNGRCEAASIGFGGGSGGLPGFGAPGGPPSGSGTANA
jgi:hypothetical protein